MLSIRHFALIRLLGELLLPVLMLGNSSMIHPFFLFLATCSMIIDFEVLVYVLLHTTAQFKSIGAGTKRSKYLAAT